MLTRHLKMAEDGGHGHSHAHGEPCTGHVSAAPSSYMHLPTLRGAITTFRSTVLLLLYVSKDQSDGARLSFGCCYCSTVVCFCFTHACVRGPAELLILFDFRASLPGRPPCCPPLLPLNPYHPRYSPLVPPQKRSLCFYLGRVAWSLQRRKQQIITNEKPFIFTVCPPNHTVCSPPPTCA